MLHLAAFSGWRYNPPLKALYERLKLAGKPMKVRLIACARKLLVILNAMMRERTQWNPSPTKALP